MITLLTKLYLSGYYIYAVEERDESTDSNKVARSIDMYHLYGSIIVMSACIILNSYHQKTLIQAVKSLNEADLQMSAYSSKISWKKSRNLIFGKI